MSRPPWLAPFDPNARGLSTRMWTVSESHHILPLSWGGPDTPENKVRLSAQLHFDVHACLNEYVRHAGPPPATVASTFSSMARRLAQWAWDNRPPNHPTPYWSPAP